MITVRRKINFSRRPNKTTSLSVVAEPASPVPTVRVPRIARLMALAIHADRLIRDGQVADQSALARLLHISQPRATQLLNLNHLAPDLQEQLLHQPAADRGREPIHERLLRPIVAEPNWNRQRAMWKQMKLALSATKVTG